MTEDHEIWFCNPVTLLENLLTNLDFKDEFDYILHRECGADGSHCFSDFMSGNWAWQQVVHFQSFTHVSFCLPEITVQDTIIKDHPEAISAFLVSLVLGSNKTTI